MKNENNSILPQKSFNLLNLKQQIEQKISAIISKVYHFQPEEIVKQVEQIKQLKQIKVNNKKGQQQKTKFQQTVIDQKQCKIINELTKQFQIPQECIINMLLINQQLILFCILKLIKLPFNQKSKQIITDLVRKIDPSLRFLKSLFKPLVQILQKSLHQVNTLNVILFTVKKLFQQQTPINQQLDSYIQLYGGQGIKCNQTTRWPFQKSGTITLWFLIYKKTHECKLFQIKNSQGVGFQIILKNGKFYFQKIIQQKKFRLMQNNSAYLCQCQWDKNIKLSIQFQIKKKFFQPIFSINVIMNNFVMTNIQVDSISYNMNDFSISMFKNYNGKFYSALILKSNLSVQVEQLNSNKGFIYENDIKNFAYIFQNQVKNVFLLYSAIRGVAVYQTVPFYENFCNSSFKNQELKIEQKSSMQEDLNINQNSQINVDAIKNQSEINYVNFLFPLKKTQSVCLFDAINRFNAQISQKGNIYQNISIKKQVVNYGSLKNYLPFLNLLKNCASHQQDFKIALNQYLLLIKNIFLNKTQALEQAHKIRFFKILAKFFDQIKLQGFDLDLICSLKQIYVSLNTRMMRESFVKDLVWSIKSAVYFQQLKFEAFIKFIKTFYNQDIQSMLVTFGITDIINFILDNYDQPNCCFQHNRASLDSNQQKKIRNYFKIVKEYFTLFENILLIKRNQHEQLQKIMKQILTIFTLNTSACFIEAFILFLSDLFSKDCFLENIFIDLMNTSNYKFSVYMCLAYSYSWKTKAKLIQLVLHFFGPTIIKQFNDQQKDEKHLISLCIKFPVIMHLPIRQSSIQSHDRQCSIDKSQDKLSMNSTSLKRYTVMKTIDQQDLQTLLNDQDIARVILEWSFSQQVVQKMQQNQNVGVSILMQIYKGSTYKIRKYISNLLFLNQKLLCLGSAIMPSFIECLFICQYDSEFYCSKDQIIYNQILDTKKNLLKLISSYKTDYSSNQLAQLLILKLIIASVKSKFSTEVARLSNRVYLLISDEMFKRYLDDLKKQQWKDQEKFNAECEKIINNAYKTLVEYFCQRGQQNQLQFEQESIQMAQKQYKIMISVLEKIFDLLIYITAPNSNTTIMNENNSRRNKFIASILFPDRKQLHVNFFSFIFVILQTMFENFQDLNISQRKTILTLQKKYLIYMVQLTENSNDLQIQSIEEELKNTFLISLAFLENKFYQYFYYGFEKHKNLDFSVESRIRKNVQDIRNMIFNIFLDMIEMIKQVDEIGSMEHKSFYELMKPKRKSYKKTSIKNFYPQLWKKTDDKIIQFMCLPTKVLRDQAKQKLQMHLIQKRLSLICSSIERALTKKIQSFINYERKNKAANQQKSVYSYITHQSLKCKKLSQTEEQITVLKYQYGQKQKSKENKRKQKHQKNKRQINNMKKKIWNTNRCFGGLWKNQKIDQFTQNNISINIETQYDKQTFQQLQNMYKRVRSKKQSKFSLTPIMKLIALPLDSFQQRSFEEIYLNEVLSSRKQSNQNQTNQGTYRSEKYLKIGLAFIKKKVIQKIMKKGIGVALNLSSQNIQESSFKNQKFFCKNIFWIKPMLVCQVNIQLNQKYLILYHQSSQQFQHLSLLKNQQQKHDLLLKQFKLENIKCYQIKTFMLKSTSIQIMLNSRKTIFISFYGKQQSIFYKFVQYLNKFKKFQLQQKIPLPFRISQPMKYQDHFQLTQKWCNRQISNFQYLMGLNIYSSRSNCDLNQYFVFPWIIKAFQKQNQQFRDLKLNMGSLGSKERLQKFKEIKFNLQTVHKDQFPQSHNFGSHYSNIAIVLQYLIRINPYSQGSKYLQGGKFDIADRLFFSIEASYINVTHQMTDVRQLIPQFFYFPEFLLNSQRFQFGIQQNSKTVNSVQLPKGYSNPFQFIQRHRQLLQSEVVSQNLHFWIDLIFGYKQNGKQADLANNKFHYLSYECNQIYVSNHQQNSQMREALESHMAYFGKTPSQIFMKPHPKRSQPEKFIIKQIPKTKIFNPFQNFTINPNIDNQLTKHLNGIFSLSSESPIYFYYSQSTKKYLNLRRNGQGIIFSIQKSTKSPKQIVLHKPNTSMNIDREFQFSIDKQQNMYLFDESIYFQNLPMACFWCEHLFIGGIWGGRILKYDINNDKINLYAKHSDTVSALCSNQQFQILVSGSMNGQIVIWNFENKFYSVINTNGSSISNSHSQPKLIFKDKTVIHQSKIYNISINTDLKVILCSSHDRSVSIIDIDKCEPIRIIKLMYPVLHSTLINYPYYCIFIQCQNNKQYCYSLNGQFLNEFQFKELQKFTCPLRVYFKEMLIIKQKKNNYFQMIQMPKLKIRQKIMFDQQYNNVFNHFAANFTNQKIQILFNTQNKKNNSSSLMIHCTQPYIEIKQNDK